MIRKRVDWFRLHIARNGTIRVRNWAIVERVKAYLQRLP